MTTPSTTRPGPSARPRVICHMVSSIDGRIVTTNWPDMTDARREYERIHTSYAADAWMCGRVTMEPFAGATRSVDDVSREASPGAARPDFTAEHSATSYAVAIDASGRLAWKSNEIDGDHVIAVITERVSDDYLAFLRARNVSYVVAGAREVDFAVALEKLAARFEIKTVMLEGGGKINGALLRAGLIDEVSLLVAPLADGAIGTPTLFDVENASAAHKATKLALLAVEQRTAGILWLRYGVVT
jgi:2,5-diamino-6-(ribosylamino)-4(3H)-pyrimidinone 5'-phosphate reductase